MSVSPNSEQVAKVVLNHSINAWFLVKIQRFKNVLNPRLMQCKSAITIQGSVNLKSMKINGNTALVLNLPWHIVEEFHIQEELRSKRGSWERSNLFFLDTPMLLEVEIFEKQNIDENFVAHTIFVKTIKVLNYF